MRIQWGDSKFPAHLFTYDAATGQIFRDGKPAGCKDSLGYYRVQGNKCRIVSHRLAWRLHHGRWPNGEIDHINGDRGDNRIVNLREATPSQNQCNRKALRTSKSGEKGVCFCNTHSRWVIHVGIKGVKRLKFYASNRMNAVLGARLIRRILHGEYAFQEAA